MSSWQEQLDRDGFVVIPGFMDDAFLSEVIERVEQLYTEEGENAGIEFRLEPGSRRLANLPAKGEIFRRTFANPQILPMIEHILGPRYKLSSHSARSAEPNDHGLQPLHVDMGALPDERGNRVANVIWMLDEFTEDNGPTRAIPGTHRSGKRPQEELEDPNGPHPDEVLVTGKAGSICVMNAHLWHGGTTNHTSRSRRALHSFYCRWDVPQQQYHKRLIPSEVQAEFPLPLRQLLALDDPYNDDISSRFSNKSGFLK